MSQLHELGEFFRQRYGNFSGTTFNVNDVRFYIVFIDLEVLHYFQKVSVF